MTPDDAERIQRYEFCSTEWVNQVRSAIERLLAEVDLSGVNASFSEEFTDPPARLLPPGSTTAGWHYRITDGSLTVDASPLRNADLRLVGDYATVIELARMRNSDPKIGPLAQAALEAGTLRYEGAASSDRRVGEALKPLHDQLVPITA
jgi:hypothetical protein